MNQKTQPPAAQRIAERPTAFALQSRAGFLIRRLLQIHTAMFAVETAGFDVTPVQCSLMTALEELGEIDQNSLSQTIGLERSSVAEVIPRLVARGLLSRRQSLDDRRVKLVKLTRKGRALVARVSPAVQRSHDRVIEALPPEEREHFLRQLALLVASNNEQSVVPLKIR